MEPKFNRKKREIFKKILQKDNITQYLEFTSDELDKYFYFFRDGEIINQLIKQVIDYEDIEKRLLDGTLVNWEQNEKNKRIKFV